MKWEVQRAKKSMLNTTPSRTKSKSGMEMMKKRNDILLTSINQLQSVQRFQVLIILTTTSICETLHLAIQNTWERIKTVPFWKQIKVAISRKREMELNFMTPWCKTVAMDWWSTLKSQWLTFKSLSIIFLSLICTLTFLSSISITHKIQKFKVLIRTQSCLTRLMILLGVLSRKAL